VNEPGDDVIDLVTDRGVRLGASIDDAVAAYPNAIVDSGFVFERDVFEGSFGTGGRLFRMFAGVELCQALVCAADSVEVWATGSNPIRSPSATSGETRNGCARDLPEQAELPPRSEAPPKFPVRALFRTNRTASIPAQLGV